MKERSTVEATGSDALVFAPTEWLAMRCLWDLGSGGQAEVAERALSRYGREISPKTVGVLLGRLAARGAVDVEPVRAGRGRPYHIYTPRIGCDESLRRQLERFLDQYLVDDAQLAVLCEWLKERSGIEEQ